MAAANTPNTTGSTIPSIPSSLNSSFFEHKFWKSLFSFMQESSRVLEEVKKETSGTKSTVMTEQERQQKIQELVQRIAEKERELSQLEAERRGMLSNYDPSLSSNSGGSGFTPPRAGVRTLPTGSPQAQTTTYMSSIYDCDDTCEGECSETSGDTSYSRYTESTRSGAQMSPQRRAMSSPVRRGVRPPTFTSSGYDSSCMQDCTEPCQQSSMDPTMARWHKKLRVPYQ